MSFSLDNSGLQLPLPCSGDTTTEKESKVWKRPILGEKAGGVSECSTLGWAWPFPCSVEVKKTE